MKRVEVVPSASPSVTTATRYSLTRRVAALMERLGAQTRFQAGANARKKGWLEL